MGTSRWGGIRAAHLVGVAFMIATALPAPVAQAEDVPKGAVPLPLKGRLTVRNDSPYYIDGKQVIPGGSIIRVEANVHIMGINKASLEVKGGLLVHGTQDAWVKIENVDFSPTVAPDNEVHLDMADLYNCTFDHGEAAAFDGGMTIENSALQGGCKFNVRMRSGYLRIMTANFKVPCVIDCTPTSATAPEVAIRTSWMNEVTISGDAHATIRDSEARGLVEGKNFTDLVIDGCDLFAGAAFRQKAEGSFAKLSLQKCNLFGGTKLVLERPASPKSKTEKVRVDKFYFGTADDKPELLDKQIADRIDDGDDNAEISVKAFWANPNSRKHVFLSDSLRRRRPPPPPE